LSYTIQDFFEGNVNVPKSFSESNIQQPLTHAKIMSGKKLTKSGFADLNLALGYKLLNTQTHKLSLSAEITIPTGNKPQGIYVFEPIYGNGCHIGLGGKIVSNTELYSHNEESMHFMCAAHYQYLFKNSEMRTLSIKKEAFPTLASFSKFAHYVLVGTIRSPAHSPLFPAANILTTKVNITPGSQFEGLIDFSYTYKRLVCDIGYSLFLKSKESLKINNWNDGVYAFINADEPTSTSYNTAINVIDQKTIDYHTLNETIATNGTAITQKIFVSLGCLPHWFNKFPTQFFVGGAYEYASSNNILSTYSLWTKLGISF
jgi:hypothetical protein